MFALAGRASPARTLILAWLAYYLFMIIVVFGNEVPRYRSVFTPFALAGAAGGLAVLGDAAARRRLLVRAGLLGRPGARGRGARALRARGLPGRSRKQRAGLGACGGLALRPRLRATPGHRAASHVPLSPRPWLTYGRALLDAGKPAEALAAYQEADRRAARYDESWVARTALPRLLRDVGRQDEADQALAAAQRLSWRADPWLVLEAAWRELPPPRTDEIHVGGDDFGAVRGFYHPRPGPEARLEWARYGGDGHAAARAASLDAAAAPGCG